MMKRKEKLAVVEPALEVQRQSQGVPGCMVLSRNDGSFEIMWNPFDRTKYESIQRVTAISENTDGKVDTWAFGKFFRADCRNMAMLSLSESGEKVLIAVTRRDDPKERTFAIEKSNFLCLARFIEQLVVKGIAVPAQTDSSPYCLEFYANCTDDVFFYIPAYIQLEFLGFTTLDAFWMSVQDFMREIIVHLDDSNALPIDPLFPIGSAAVSTHQRVLQKFEAFTESLPKYERITKDEFPKLFNARGQLVDPASFRLRCFYAGVDADVLREALPFVFGVYEPESTVEEREAQYEQMKADYQKFTEQVAAIKQPQLDHHKKLAGSFRVIMQDVGRTDRAHIAFKQDHKPGLEMLAALLKAYCLYNQSIGYLQGMNDLFVPIMLTYFPKWNEDGMPLDADGNVITDYMKTAPIIFWCFDAMLNRTKHLRLLSNVTEQCQEKARVVMKMVSKVSPLAAIWMRRNNIQELLWMYSDFLLMFKRTYENIWPIWLQLNCAPDSESWSTYFVVALLLKAFPSIVAADQPICITTVMDMFPRIIQAMPVRDIAAVAVWLYENCPLDRPEQPPKEEIPDTFEFFETSWSKRKSQ